MMENIKVIETEFDFADVADEDKILILYGNRKQRKKMIAEFKKRNPEHDLLPLQAGGGEHEIVRPASCRLSKDLGIYARTDVRKVKIKPSDVKFIVLKSEPANINFASASVRSIKDIRKELMLLRRSGLPERQVITRRTASKRFGKDCVNDMINAVLTGVQCIYEVR